MEDAGLIVWLHLNGMLRWEHGNAAFRLSFKWQLAVTVTVNTKALLFSIESGRFYLRPSAASFCGPCCVFDLQTENSLNKKPGVINIPCTACTVSPGSEFRVHSFGGSMSGGLVGTVWYLHIFMHTMAKPKKSNTKPGQMQLSS